jgi:glycosyltransferase involved in cell wall biosynthesis
MPSSLLVLLPGYNVARYLPDLIPRIRNAVPEAAICLVDDGSADDTAERAESLGVDVVRHAANRGKGEALKTGFAHAIERGFGAVLTLDADGQHLPEEIPAFVAGWQAGHAIVVGSRMHANETMPWVRKRTNEVMSAIISRLARQRIDDSQSGFRLIDTDVLRHITLESRRYDLESEILIKAGRLGYSIGSVPISTVYHDQESSIDPVVDTLRFLRLLWRAQRWH